MKIGILGTPVSSSNRGVQALGSSLVNLCYQGTNGGEVLLFVGNRDNEPAVFRICGEVRSVQVVNCRMSPLSRLCDHLVWIIAMSLAYRLLPIKCIRRAIAHSTPWISSLADVDVVGDVHGGDSFSDIYGLRRLLLGFLMSWTVVLVKGSIVQFPQTFGPYKSALARKLARTLLMRSSVIIARDKQSRRVAQELTGSRKEVQLSPDVAFSLEPITPDGIELDHSLAGTTRPNVIGLNVNGLMYHGGYTRKNMFGLKLHYAAFLEALVTALMAGPSGELWLVPHTFAPTGDVESDPEASRTLRDRLPTELRARIRIVTRQYDQHQIKGLIGKCDFFIGSRMHACIAALSQGIPCVGVAYSRKFAGVFETVGMVDWVVDGRDTTKEEAVRRILELYQRRNDVRDRLRQSAEKARTQLLDVFSELFRKAERADLGQTRKRLT